MPKPEPKYLCWWDCETTGLDHVMDPILEVAIIVTDMNLSEEEFGESPNASPNRFHSVVDPGDWWIEDRLSKSDFVRKMHTDNGLLIDIRKGGAKTSEAAEVAILTLLKSLPLEENECIFLAGSGVAAFDRPVIAAHMPDLDAFLDYRMIDLGHIRRFLSDIVQVPDDLMPPKQDDAHRAQSDVENTLVQARVMKEMLDYALSTHEFTQSR